MITFCRNPAFQALIGLAVVLAAGSAFAEKPDTASRRATPRSVDHRQTSSVASVEGTPTPEPPDEVYYRAPLAAAYGVSITSMAVGFAVAHDRSSEEIGGGMFFVGAGGLLLAPPITHFAYGNYRGGFSALAGTIGFGAIGAYTGAQLGASMASGDWCDDSCALIGGAYGVVIGGMTGALVWGAIDVAFLAHSRPQQPRLQAPDGTFAPKRKPSRHSKPITVLPSISPMLPLASSGASRPGVLFSLNGTF